VTLLAPFLSSLTTENGIQTRITNPHSWTTPRAPVLGFIDEHLAGGRSIGLRGADQIQYLMVDIDCHNGEPIQASLDLLLNAFPGSSLPFRSSDSNGVHFYIFLDEIAPRTKAREALRNKLISINYPDAEKVEIFPWSSRGHRLPFGIGNRPMPGGKDTLANSTRADQQSYFPKWFKKELRPYKLADLYKYTSTLINKHTAVKTPLRAQNTGQEHAPINTEQLRGRAFYLDPVFGIDTLLSQGIASQGMRYQATNALAFYYIQNKGLSKAETVRKITAWLDEKHNGQSACYNQDQAKAYQDIINIVGAFDSSKLNPEKAHIRTPQNTVKPIHFSNDSQRHFAQAIQTLAHKFGIKAHTDGSKSNGEITAHIPYGLVARDSRISKNRNTIAECFKWARDSGLLILLKAGFPGQGGSWYTVSPAILYGRHGKPTINQRQRLAYLIQEHGTQKAVAELLGVSVNMISKVMTGKAPIPKTWFEPVQVSRINQIDTLLSSNLCLCACASKKELLTRASNSESQKPIIISEPLGGIRGRGLDLIVKQCDNNAQKQQDNSKKVLLLNRERTEEPDTIRSPKKKTFLTACPLPVKQSNYCEDNHGIYKE